MRRWLSDHARAILKVVAGLGVFHFAISMLGWGGLFLIALRQSRHGGVEWLFFLDALPAVLLLVLFLVAFRAAFRSTRRSLVLVLVAVCLSCVAFAYDAGTRSWQFHAETYSGPDSGPTFHYCTWWWYGHN